MASDPVSVASAALNFVKFVRELVNGNAGAESQNATQALLTLNAACEATLSYEAYRDQVAGKRDPEREIRIARAWDDVAVWVGKFAAKDEAAALLVARLETKGRYWCEPGDILPEDIERLGIGLEEIRSDVRACLRQKQ